MEASIERTRCSIPTRLKLAGVQYEVTSSADGALRYVVDGETLTPGEAVDRYLRMPPRPQHGDVYVDEDGVTWQWERAAMGDSWPGVWMVRF